MEAAAEADEQADKAAVEAQRQEARRQAAAEGLVLQPSDSPSGFHGVCFDKSRGYKARPWRGGKHVYLGIFATPEEAALCVARAKANQGEAVGAGAAGAEAKEPSSSHSRHLAAAGGRTHSGCAPRFGRAHVGDAVRGEPACAQAVGGPGADAR